MIPPLAGLVNLIITLIIAAAIFGLLWWLVTKVAALFPGEAANLFVKVAYVVLLVVAVLLVINLLLGLTPGPVFYR